MSVLTSLDRKKCPSCGKTVSPEFDMLQDFLEGQLSLIEKPPPPVYTTMAEASATPVNDQLPFGQSYWDYLPDMIQDYIFDMAEKEFNRDLGARALHKNRMTNVCSLCSFPTLQDKGVLSVGTSSHQNLPLADIGVFVLV